MIDFEYKHDVHMQRYDVESKENWREWVERIPNISFPADWRVKIIPPFGGALVRFLVIKGEKRISVYLDVFERLGFYGGPYWEIYPYGTDVYRVSMENTEELIQKITEELNGDTVGIE